MESLQLSQVLADLSNLGAAVRFNATPQVSHYCATVFCLPSRLTFTAIRIQELPRPSSAPATLLNPVTPEPMQLRLPPPRVLRPTTSDALPAYSDIGLLRSSTSSAAESSLPTPIQDQQGTPSLALLAVANLM